MNKLKSIIMGGIAVLALASCSDDQYNEFYNNPNEVTKAPCATLFTATLYDKDGRDYTFNQYWRVYTWDNIFGKYAQTCGYANNSGNVYFYNDGYANDRWNGFYRRLAQFRQLENTYANEDPSAQANDLILKDLAEVFIIDHATQIADLFGDTPYSKAGMLGITNDIVSSRAAFDDDVEIYRNAINRLGELYTEIESLKGTLSDNVKSTLIAGQDFINRDVAGDDALNHLIDRWLMYANSLRLRLAVRVALNGELAAFGQSAIKECMNRQLVTDAYDQIEVRSDEDGFNFWENFRDGYKDINNVASQPMIDAMSRVKGQPDYRMYVMYIANKDGDYIGASNAEAAAFQKLHGSAFNGFAGGSLSFADRYYSHLDSVTYTGNRNFISPIISAAEVDFLRAEAIQNGWGSGDAKSAFINGMVNSTKFYYRQNKVSESVQGYVGVYPGDDAVKAYAEAVWESYTNKLEAIMTMKWVHFGIIQPTQAFTDIRRTGYPTLNYPSDVSAQVCKDRPNRIKWPNSEKANNADNFAAAESAQPNEYSTKLFWAK